MRPRIDGLAAAVAAVATVLSGVHLQHDDGRGRRDRAR